jgi:hypothetical protein
VDQFWGWINDHLAFVTGITTLGGVLYSTAISARNGKAIHDVHISINSRMDELLRRTIVSERLDATKVEKDRASAETEAVKAGVQEVILTASQLPPGASPGPVPAPSQPPAAAAKEVLTPIDKVLS